MNLLISAQELNSILNTGNLIIIDASQDNSKLGKTSEFDGLQISRARWFDLNKAFSEPNSEFPNTFPTAEQFQKGCQKLGINKDNKIVVYDNLGIFNSPRVWWMFKTFGHDNIAALDGGLPEWIKLGYETEPKQSKEYITGNFEANLHANQVKYIDDIKANIISDECLIVDARSEARFNGAPEPRAGLRSGNIPNSKNLPFQNLLDDGKFKSIKEIKELFQPFVNEEKSFIFTCGSGVTACILLFAYQLAFDKEASIYDGSWTEWGTLVN